MSRVRISTTVDADLLASCREKARAHNDAALMDEALGALLSAHRRAEYDKAADAYLTQPLDTHDEWGDLASFLDSHESARRAARAG